MGWVKGATNGWYRVARRHESCADPTAGTTQWRKIRALRAKVGGLEPIRFQEGRRFSKAHSGAAAGGWRIYRTS